MEDNNIQCNRGLQTNELWDEDEYPDRGQSWKG